MRISECILDVCASDRITDSGLACLIADNYAVEGLPARESDSGPVEGSHAMLPLHEHCLFKLGIPLGELWYLSDLAAWLKQHGRSRFMLTAPPLPLTGAVGSPASPISTVFCARPLSDSRVFFSVS